MFCLVPHMHLKQSTSYIVATRENQTMYGSLKNKSASKDKYFIPEDGSRWSKYKTKWWYN